tara:strand:+ start:320 stop:520 length:201 start_codon:yes stop_codon:yes gene_type:complete
MKNFEDLDTYTPKKLRTLRNNLNNRLAHFKERGEEQADKLRPSHKLHGLDEEQCKELLGKVSELLK